MRRLGRPSWQITVDLPQVLAVALYVRDVAGVRQTACPADLPSAVPPVPADRGSPPSPERTAQWNAWWTRALTAGPHALRDLEPPGFPALADAPALHDLLCEHFDGARRWSSDLRRSGATGRDLPFGDLVREVERGLGRAAAPFDLRLDVVPVAGHGIWTVRPAHLLVSSPLLADPAVLVARLRAEVERLA